ncbi:MAG: M55 family metallopeptidase [Clostridia bacterium]|nr:M55 family metallopeptidase [Clostridia bacterium]
MNILMMTDLEGITGVDSIDMIPYGSEGYRNACIQLEKEINTVVRGFFDGGADHVYVIDGHGGGNNFNPEQIDRRAVVLKYPAWEKIVQDGLIDAYAEIGLHAMAGTEHAFLDHTQSSVKIFDYTINGVSYGELGQAAAFVGAFDVPVIMVSGDHAICEEAKNLIEGISVAPVKQALCRNKAVSLPEKEARELLYTTAKNSLRSITKIKPFKVPLPAEVRWVYQRADYCDEVMEQGKFERLNARTVRKKVTGIYSYFDLL